ncbi:hypothetical protein HRbin35_00624 [bacterium HR35]|nr:hypothetical protein HRbin35_00624 [bacterium HR35]
MNKTSFWLIPLLIIIFWLTKEIIFSFFMGTVIGLTIQNLSRFLSLKLKLPYYLLVFLLYFLIFFFFGFLIYSLFKVITLELPGFISHLNNFLKAYNLKIEKLESIKNFDFLTIFQSHFVNVFSFLYSLFGNFISVILVFIISIYIALSPNLERDIFAYLPEEKREEIFNIWFRIKRKLSFWILGQIILMLTIGLATYLVYGIIFDMPYKFLISLTAGVLEAVPILGPIISTIIAVFIAIIEKPEIVFLLIASFFLIQQLENHFLVPLVMKNTVKLNPLLVLLGILISSNIFGFWGAISILPLLVIFKEVFDYYFKKD